MNYDFDEFFKIPIRAMKINRSHPNVKRDKKWFIHFIITFGIFTAVFLLLLYNIALNLKTKDFNQTCKNGVLTVVYYVIAFQYIIMIWKQDLLQKIILSMKKDYEKAKLFSIYEQKIMFKYIKMGVHVCNQWLIITSCGTSVFFLKSLVLLSYQVIIGDPKLIPFYDLVYPEVIERNKDNIFVYIGLYVLLLYYALYASCMYTAFVPLGPIFILHLCGQLEIVENKIKGIFDGGMEVEERLKEIIKQLQYIYSFSDQILLTFRVNYELTLKGTTMMLPITCYEVIEAFHNGEVSLEFIAFIVGGTLISSSPCYYSDLLMEKGESVRIAVYSSGWESTYDAKIRSTLSIILMRASKPVAIRTLFRIVCLEALTDLFQQSYAIFNLMNAMWK